MFYNKIRLTGEPVTKGVLSKAWANKRGIALGGLTLASVFSQSTSPSLSIILGSAFLATQLQNYAQKRELNGVLEACYGDNHKNFYINKKTAEETGRVKYEDPHYIFKYYTAKSILNMVYIGACANLNKPYEYITPKVQNLAHIFMEKGQPITAQILENAPLAVTTGIVSFLANKIIDDFAVMSRFSKMPLVYEKISPTLSQDHP